MGVRDLSEKHQRGYLDTSVSPWKPESGYEETEGHLKKSQALDGCSLEKANGQGALCPQQDRLGTRVLKQGPMMHTPVRPPLASISW